MKSRARVKVKLHNIVLTKFSQTDSLRHNTAKIQCSAEWAQVCCTRKYPVVFWWKDLLQCCFKWSLEWINWQWSEKCVLCCKIPQRYKITWNSHCLIAFNRRKMPLVFLPVGIYITTEMYLEILLKEVKPWLDINCPDGNNMVEPCPHCKKDSDVALGQPRSILT